MKKSYIYILIIAIIITTIIIDKKKEEKSFIIDNIRYFTSLDGNSTNYFPEKGSYEVNVNCTNATGIWNYNDWTMDIYDITGEVSCNISFTSKESVSISDYIEDLLNTEQGTGQLVNENGYRYEGKNPNNYIYFNNELWRIIGVFDETSHGISDTYLTKIIRDDYLGGYVWNISIINNWATSSLYNLLNTYYYNATDGTNSDNCKFYIGNDNEKVVGNCDYTVIGIQNNYRNMIENATWYLGGKDNANYTVEKFYIAERDSTAVVSSGTESNASSVMNYIGLMYASDYGYSVLSSSCERTTSLDNYSGSECSGSSWMIKGINEWTITPSSLYYGNSFAVRNNSIYDQGSNNMIRWAIRPVLYLKSNVQVYAGDGSITNPYQIMLLS